MQPAGYIIIVLAVIFTLLIIKRNRKSFQSAEEQAETGKSRVRAAEMRPEQFSARDIRWSEEQTLYLGRTEPAALGWISVHRSDLPDSVVDGYEDFGYFTKMLGLLPDRKTLVCGVAYERYEVEHQAGGLSQDSVEWVTHYDYYRVNVREVSPGAVNELLKKCGIRTA